MQNEFEYRSYLFSIVMHSMLILILLLINLPISHEEPEFVTVGFGSFGNLSSSGKVDKNQNQQKEENKNEIDSKESVNLPKALNQETENLLTEKSDKKNRFEESFRPLKEENKKTESGHEFYGEGTGKFGFDIDFGGKGMRKIYSYSLPQYPEGVYKEIDVKLRFTILADGTVGNIIPIIKADTRLEEVAIKSLRQWRFEPLTKNQKSVEQTAIIIFPFRLQ